MMRLCLAVPVFFIPHTTVLYSALLWESWNNLCISCNIRHVRMEHDSAVRYSEHKHRCVGTSARVKSSPSESISWGVLFNAYRRPCSPMYSPNHVSDGMKLSSLEPIIVVQRADERVLAWERTFLVESDFFVFFFPKDRQTNTHK